MGTVSSRAEIEAKINQLKSFIEVDSTNPHLFINLGDLYQKISKNDEAEDCYRQSLEIDDTPIAQSRLGLIKISRHQFKDAERIFTQLLKTYDEQPSALIFNLALAQYYLKKWGRSLKNFKKAMETGTNDTLCLPYISRCYNHLHDYNSAKEHCTSWIEKTNSLEAKGYLSLLEMDSGNSDKAKLLAREVLKDDPTNADAGVVIGSCLIETHDITKAQTQFDTILKKDNQQPRALFGMGLTFMYQQDHEKALLHMEQASLMIPNDTGMKIAIGWAKVSSNDLDGAGKTFQESIAIDRNFSEGHGGLAYVLALQGKITQAKKSMETAFWLDPNSFSASATKSVVIGFESGLDKSAKYLANVLETPQGPGQKPIIEHIESYMKNQKANDKKLDPDDHE